MEKPDRPVDTSFFGLKDGESEIVDADLLVNLLETYRFGKGNVPVGEFRSKAAAATAPPENITEIEDEEDNDGSQGIVNLSFSYMFVFYFLIHNFKSLKFQLHLLL